MLTAGPVSKMAPQQEKAFCVLRFEVSRSVITVQREFRAATVLLQCNHRSGHLKTEHTESLFLLRRHHGNWPGSKHEKRTAGSAWETWPVAAADGVRCTRVRWKINFLLTFEIAPFFCVYPVWDFRWGKPEIPYQGEPTISVSVHIWKHNNVVCIKKYNLQFQDSLVFTQKLHLN